MFYWKRDEMRGLPSILSLFRNELNKSNITRATKVRFYLSQDISYEIAEIGKTSRFCYLLRNVICLFDVLMQRY